MARDPAQPTLTFLPRHRGGAGASTPASVDRFARQSAAGQLRSVVDLGFALGTGRVTWLRVSAEGGSAVCDAVLTTPLRNGRVVVPPAGGLGWRRTQPADGGLRWVSAVAGAPVVDCGGRLLGCVHALVVDHLRQRVLDLLLDDGSRVAVAEVAFLRDGRVLIEDAARLTADLDLWLALQQDVECGRLWWVDAFQAPPALESRRVGQRA